MDYQELINKLKVNYQNLLGDNLVGIYLHGSFVMSGFNPNRSDLDFLVVVKEEFGDFVKRALIELTIKLEDHAPAKGLEMSIITVDTAKNPNGNLPFLLHYSKAHRERNLSNPDYICQGKNDSDLLTHIMVINHRGKKIVGPDIDEVFGQVNEESYIRGFMYDLNDAKNGITTDFEYYILNFCRSLMFLEEGLVSSKLEGGIWAQKRYPEFAGLIKKAITVYKDDNESDFNIDLVNMFIKTMFHNIMKKS